MQARGPSYRATLSVPGFGRLMAATLAGRAAQAMLSVVLVLFVLQRFHSPALAGITVFASIGPSLLLSPLAGALLDRYGRARLIMLDYLVAGASLAALAGLSLGGLLTAPLLLALAVVSGITGILSAAGMRSMVPLLLPEELWGRGNALDSSGYTITIIVGPALGGFLVGTVGPEVAILVAGAVYAAAAVTLLGAPEAGPHVRHESLLASALAGIRYLAGHPVLRGIATSMLAVNLGAGIVTVGMPVLALQQLHGTSAAVGLLWAAQGVGGATAGFAFGRISTRGRERRVIVAAILGAGVATAVMAVSPNLWILGAGSLLVGLVTGPLDVTLFSLRQRVTGTEWLGRAIALSMSLNYIGFPLGSALSGAVIGVGVRFALGVATVLVILGAAICAAMLRPASAATGSGPRRSGDARDQGDRQQDQGPAGELGEG